MKITEKIHCNYQDIDKNIILNTWSINTDKYNFVSNPKFDLGRAPRTKFYSRADYYNLLGEINLLNDEYEDALINFNTALYIYDDDYTFIEGHHIANADLKRKIVKWKQEFPNKEFRVGNEDVISKNIIFFNRIKVLIKIKEYNLVIEDALKIMESDTYEEFKTIRLNDLKLKQYLVKSYIKTKQYSKALELCDEIENLLNFDQYYIISLTKSYIYEQIGDYLAALEEVNIGEYSTNKREKQTFLKRYRSLLDMIYVNIDNIIAQYESIQKYEDAAEIVSTIFWDKEIYKKDLSIEEKKKLVLKEANIWEKAGDYETALEVLEEYVENKDNIEDEFEKKISDLKIKCKSLVK